MAETASILCPEKTVLLPCPDAGCPMAEMVDPAALTARKKNLGDIPVLKADAVLMTPNKNLAQYAAGYTDKKIHLWEGYCPFDTI